MRASDPNVDKGGTSQIAQVAACQFSARWRASWSAISSRVGKAVLGTAFSQTMITPTPFF